jgi:hypothetical protein
MIAMIGAGVEDGANLHFRFSLFKFLRFLFLVCQKSQSGLHPSINDHERCDLLKLSQTLDHLVWGYFPG